MSFQTKATRKVLSTTPLPEHQTLLVVAKRNNCLLAEH